jgi:hypothetical protein
MRAPSGPQLRFRNQQKTGHGAKAAVLRKLTRSGHAPNEPAPSAYEPSMYRCPHLELGFTDRAERFPCGARAR